MNAHTTAQATLFQRYLAQCESDAVEVLTRVCREAGAAPAGSSLWVAPAQRQARALLPGLAPRWLDWLDRPTAAAQAVQSMPQPFITDGFGVPTGLALMSDDDVDEDIESTRVVQAIESAAEWTLRDLRSRLASAPSLPGSTPDEVLPLAPARVVSALCGALHEETTDAPTRLAALRCAAEPLASALATLYQQHAQLLSAWGLQPVRYTIRREPEPRRGPAATPAMPRAGEPAAVGVAASQIPALLAHVAGEAGLSAGMQALMGRLAGPVARSVAADPGLLDSVDNPLWRLIDRLAAIGQLDAPAAPGTFELPLHLRLEPIIARLEQSRQPMPPERYAQALAEAEAEARGVADLTPPATAPSPAPVPFRVTGLAIAPTQAGPLSPPPSSPPAHSESALAHVERRQALEPLVRGQMVARLKDAHVLPAVKQFLLGPWASSIVQVIAAHGDESAPAQRALNAVEAFIDGGSYARRMPLTPAELDCLRLEAADGLAATPGLPPAHAKQHVNDLVAALGTWPRPAPDTLTSPDELLPPEEEPLENVAWPTHDELATVPIALDAHNPDERSLRACEAWLDGLAVGDICRIQRQGQWATLRLNWRSDNGAYYAFGNSTGLAFSVSRRVLGRMRLEGLATTMARGQWVRRAADTLPMPLE
jgi:hypothetical protein